MPKASNSMFDCVDPSLEALLPNNAEASDRFNVLTIYVNSPFELNKVLLFLPSFSVRFFLQQLCTVFVVTRTWLAGALCAAHLPVCLATGIWLAGAS